MEKIKKGKEDQQAIKAVFQARDDRQMGQDNGNRHRDKQSDLEIKTKVINNNNNNNNKPIK